MDPKIKEMLDQLNSAFAAFRTSNDERLAQIEARGTADPLVTASVNRANADISAIQTQMKEHTAALREVETMASRFAPQGSPEAVALEQTHARSFLSYTQNRVIEQVSNDDLATYRAYKRAFSAYLRRGDAIQDASIRAALQTGQAPAGGFWVTPDISGKMVEFIYQSSPIRQVASVQAIGTDMLEGTADLTEGSSGWVAETGARAETTAPDVPFPWRIPVHEQFANPRTTQKLLDDTNFNVEAWLAKKTADKIARTENTAFVTGLGVSSPRGFTTYTAGTPLATVAGWQKVQQINSGASGAFATTNPVDKLIDVIHSIKAPLRGAAQWAMNNLTLAEARKLKDGEGHYLLNPDISTAGITNRLLGYGVVEMQDLADMSSASLSMVFANWAEAYQIVDHTVGIRTLRDPYTAKPYVQFYTTKRVGGGIVNFEAIKLVKFSA